MPPLDLLLREYITPGLRSADWKKTRGNYTWLATNGDRAIITFYRSMSTQADVSTFAIEVGLLPLPAAEMKAYWIPMPKTPQASLASFSGCVLPASAGVQSLGGMFDLTNDDVGSLGPTIRSIVVDDVAPTLVQSLDRQTLLRWDAGRSEAPIPDIIGWTTSGWGPLPLIADEAPPEEIDAELDRMRSAVPSDADLGRPAYLNALIPRTELPS